MAKVTDGKLFRLVHDYLKVYLPTQKDCSPHTIKSYQTTLNLFLNFIKKENDVFLSQVTFEMLNSQSVTAFLEYVETQRGCSVSTRNHRLLSLRSFFKYAAMMEPTAVVYHMDVKKVAEKKTVKNRIPDFMSENAVKSILKQPDTTTKTGLRDQFLMILLYDTGARIQEVLSLRVKDIHLGSTPTATLFGKGSKLRTVPLMAKTAEHARNYLGIFHPEALEKANDWIFYVERRGYRQQMSDDNVRSFMKKYGVAARTACPDVPENIYPHLWRHSRAMHLYRHGMDLTMVSQWLGHSSLETTLIYASADTEHKREAIQKATMEQSPLFENSDFARFQVDDDTLVRKLYGLL